jgi:hypothetical protein
MQALPASAGRGGWTIPYFDKRRDAAGLGAKATMLEHPLSKVEARYSTRRDALQYLAALDG